MPVRKGQIMKTKMSLFLAIVSMASISGQASAGGEGWAPAVAAAREVSSQIDSMQRAMITIPSAPGGRGLFGQTEGIRVAIYKFRLTISQQQSKENIAVAFFALDDQVKQLLFDLKGIDNVSVNFVARRLSVAEADLQYAVIGPGANATQQAQALARQTLALAARAEDIEGVIRFAFLEQGSLADWMAGVKDLQQMIAKFKTQQEKNAPPEVMKAALMHVDQSWEKIVDRLTQIPELTYVLVQTDAVQLDAVLGRIDRMVGVANRKGRLPAKLLQP